MSSHEELVAAAERQRKSRDYGLPSPEYISEFSGCDVSIEPEADRQLLVDYALAQLTAPAEPGPTREELLADNARMRREIEAAGNNPAGFDWSVLERLDRLEMAEERLAQHGHDDSDYGPDGKPLPVDEEWLRSMGFAERPGMKNQHRFIESGPLQVWMHPNGWTWCLWRDSRQSVAIQYRWQVRRLVAAMGGTLGEGN